MYYLNKYGIRFGIALVVSILFQTSKGNWDWLDFLGRSLTTILVVALSYPVEAWIRRKVPDSERD